MFNGLKYPELDAHGFLERAYFWLDSGIDVGIFYAALDLRFSFEKTLIRHGFASEDSSKKFEKLKSQPHELHRKLKDEYAGRIDIRKSYRFLLRTDDRSVSFGYYLAVPDDLFADYGKLDNFLHAQWGILIGTPDKAWYRTNSASLSNFAQRLIPHANPKNSLDYFNLPSIEAEEIDSAELENELRKYWA